MSTSVFPPSFRVTDANDNPVAGGQVRYFAGGTSTPRAVYSDAALATSLGTVVNLNAAGVPVSGANTPVMVYLGEGGTYKIEFYDSAGVLVPGMSFDLIPGAVAAAAAVTEARPLTPVLSRVATFTPDVATHQGVLFELSGSNFPVTLPSAVTAGDGFLVGFRHNDPASRQYPINALAGQPIKGQNYSNTTAPTSISLTSRGETLWVTANGAEWVTSNYVPPFMKAHTPFFTIADRLTAPPSSPTPGARYIVNGTPTGAWSTLSFALHDIAEADGNGSWIKYTPSEGWFAYVEDENLFTAFVGTAWADQTGMAAAQSSTLYHAIFEDQKANGTVGGTPTTGAWTTRVLNTQVVNTIDGCALASNQITLPVGRYLIHFAAAYVRADNVLTRIKTISGTVDVTELRSLPQAIGNSTNPAIAYHQIGCGFLNVTAQAVVALQYHVQTADGGTSGLGSVSDETDGEAETYARVSIMSLASLQGATGAAGPQGALGPTGNTGPTGPTGSTSFNFDNATADADPGSGDLRLNNATPASATAAYIDNNNRGSVDVSAWLDTFDDTGAAALRGQMVIFDAAAPTTVFRIYNIIGSVVDGTGYRKVTIAHVTGNGAFTNGNELVVAFFYRGFTGAGDLTSTNNLSDVASAATSRTNLGVGTGNSPEFTAVNVGHASDTTVSRAEAGVLAVESVPLYSNMPVNSQSAAYTAVLGDAQKFILHPTADNNARQFTIPANASVAYPIGTVLTFVNEINVVTIAITTDTLVLAGSGATGSRTLAANGFATALKKTSTSWIISGSGLS